MVREHDALGEGRRAARVHEDRRLVVLDLRFRLELLGGRDQLLVAWMVAARPVDADDGLELGERGREGPHRLEVALADEENSRPPRLQHVLELGELGPVVERDEDAAEQGRRVVRLDGAVGVDAEGGDPRATPDTQVRERPREPSGA